MYGIDLGFTIFLSIVFFFVLALIWSYNLSIKEERRFRSYLTRLVEMNGGKVLRIKMKSLRSEVQPTYQIYISFINQNGDRESRKIYAEVKRGMIQDKLHWNRPLVEEPKKAPSNKEEIINQLAREVSRLQSELDDKYLELKRLRQE